VATGVLVYTLNTADSYSASPAEEVASWSGWTVFSTILVSAGILIALAVVQGIAAGRIDWRSYIPSLPSWNIGGVAGRIHIPWKTVLSVGGCWIVLLIATRYWFPDSAWKVLWTTGITMLTIALIFGILARSYGGVYGKTVSVMIFVLATIAVVKTSWSLGWYSSAQAATNPTPRAIDNDRIVLEKGKPVTIIVPPAPHWSPVITTTQGIFSETSFHSRATGKIWIDRVNIDEPFLEDGPGIKLNLRYKGIHDLEQRYQAQGSEPIHVLVWIGDL
jgi:hypothetical protein